MINMRWSVVAILSCHLSIFLYFVTAENMPCPTIETIAGVEPNQMAGEWYAIHAVLLEDMPEIPADVKTINSPKCRALKIGSLNDNKMSLNSRFMTFNSSNRTVSEDFNGYYNIQKIGDDFQADIFTKSIEGVVSVEDENPDLYTYVFSVVPDKYLVYMQCRVVEKEKQHVSGGAIFSRRSIDSNPVITEEEKVAIVEQIKQKTGGEITIEMFFPNDCFNTDREFF